ncbi:MAG: trigger factor [Thiohalocapsa sp.]|uniref:trigger factor n=1 Tax=Thiohalocapsa sp. TaxID=2497641 RepID=UPI0025F70999|nr:trigger factor [Thiohalocapsa sp.]MCG6943370.1 trigger factor [Thiohalocapsa sp.]
MQVTVEAGEGLARRMTVELPADDVEQQVDQRLRDVARQARLPGFRPGKVPMRVLRQRFAESVRGEVLGEMVQSSFSQAVAEQELRPAGRPEIEPDIDADGRRYAYTASFEVLPEIELHDLGGMRIVRPVAEVADADVDRMIERLREQRKTFADVDRGAQEGDRLTISFVGSIDGEPFEGGSAERRPLVLGKGEFIPGFEQQLEGAGAGEERVVEVTFPEDYPAERLAGRAAQFQVTVEAVAEPRLPEVDADFMAAFGIGDGDMEHFRADVRSNMERELRQRIEAKVKNAVMDALIEANPVELPAVLVAEEIQALKGQTRQAVGAGSMELPDELFADSAQRRVKLGLVVAEVVKRHDLTPAPERVRALVEEMAATYERPEEVIEYYYADPRRLSSVEALAMEEMVVERMLESADVVEEESTFDALTESESDA